MILGRRGHHNSTISFYIFHVNVSLSFFYTPCIHFYAYMHLAFVSFSVLTPYKNNNCLFVKLFTSYKKFVIANVINKKLGLLNLFSRNGPIKNGNFQDFCILQILVGKQKMRSMQIIFNHLSFYKDFHFLLETNLGLLTLYNNSQFLQEQQNLLETKNIFNVSQWNQMNVLTVQFNRFFLLQNELYGK